MIPFVESVLFQPTQEAKSRTKLESRFIEGIYLGINGRTNEGILYTDDGFQYARSIRRRPADERWNKMLLMRVKGSYLNINGSDDVHYPDTPFGYQPNQQDDNTIERRRAQITLADTDEHGDTEGCKGCRAARRRERGIQHSEECRKRLEDAMLADPRTSDKIKRSMDRVNEAVAEKMKKGMGKDIEMKEPEATTTSSTSSTTWLRVGASIRLKDLKVMKELNNKVGTIISYNADKGKWQVKLDEGCIVFAAVANLQPPIFVTQEENPEALDDESPPDPPAWGSVSNEVFRTLARSTTLNEA